MTPSHAQLATGPALPRVARARQVLLLTTLAAALALALVLASTAALAGPALGRSAALARALLADELVLAPSGSETRRPAIAHPAVVPSHVPALAAPERDRR